MRKKRRKLGKGKVISLNQMPLGRNASSGCPFAGKDAPIIDYKDVKLLQGFVSEQGKMTPSRITFVAQKKQRRLAREMKRARFLALMPFVREDKIPKQYTQSRQDNMPPSDDAPPSDMTPSDDVPDNNFEPAPTGATASPVGASPVGASPATGGEA